MLRLNQYRRIPKTIIRRRFIREHWKLLKKIIQLGDQEHVSLYIVGGFVRDLLLRRRKYQLDVDLVLEGDAIEFAKKVQSLLGGKLILYPQFRTATLICSNHENYYKQFADNKRTDDYSVKEMFQIDFITARKETYSHPGALPTVTPSCIYDDIYRRDFTINTLAIKINRNQFGRFIDVCCGKRDICLGIIRTLHKYSFKDDPTRIMRAIRYEQRFNFLINRETLEQLQKYKHFLSTISPHRIRREFDRIFLEETSKGIMERINELSVLSEIYPGLSWDKRHSTQMSFIKNNISLNDFLVDFGEFDNLSTDQLIQWAIYTMWFSTYKDHLPSLFERFDIEAKLRKILLSFILIQENNELIKKGTISELVDFLDKANPLGVYFFYITTTDEEIKSKIRSYIKQYKSIDIPYSIKQYIYSTIRNKTFIKNVIKEIRSEILDNKIINEEEAIQRVNQLLEDEK